MDYGKKIIKTAKYIVEDEINVKMKRKYKQKIYYIKKENHEKLKLKKRIYNWPKYMIKTILKRNEKIQKTKCSKKK